MESKEYIKQACKLKKEFEFAIKDQDRFLVSCRGTLREELEDLDLYTKDINTKSEQSKRVLFNSISRLKKQVGEVQSRLGSFISSTKSQGIGPDYDFQVSSLQKSSDLINSEILQFKERSRVDYEELSQSEKIIENELEYYTQKFSQWENEVPRVQKPSFKSMQEPKDLPPLKQDLLQIEKEIEDFGGATLGWDDTDHTEFIKVWNKFKGKSTPAFFQAAANALPLHEINDIKEHTNKYTTFLALNEQKKVVLQRWRDEKQKTVKQEVEVVQETSQRVRPQSAVAARQKLEEWKTNRERAKEEEAERKKVEEERRKEVEMRKKALIEEKKQMVLEYKEKKEFEKARTNLINDYIKRKEKVELSEDDKLRIKEREDKIVEQKKSRVISTMKTKEEKEKLDTMTKLKNQAQWSHVDSKLNQETFSVKARKEATTNPSESRPQTFGGMLVHRPTRAVPTWRAGL